MEIFTDEEVDWAVEQAETEALIRHIADSLSFHGARLKRRSIRLALKDLGDVSDDFLVKLSSENPLLKIETENHTSLILKYMPNYEENQRGLSNLLDELFYWNRIKNNKQGQFYDSNSTVRFADGSKKEPDITYILKSELKLIPQKSFITVTPTFLVEWFSTYDDWEEAQAKMDFYMKQGVKLAWLVVPQHKQTYIYRPDRELKTIPFSELITGEDVLVGFEVVIDALLSEE
ncbi:Uma2 family endonuclease [Thermoflexibacter ruber]|uniref:Endonuclease, Uma2 family (Restriction endonuclease fold) n=1 Tax=Thermoflexibacter ruber TaxID=1003 RepID=A0A1I2G8Z6_9BACT|nr:Uma2 family endonuclease [Thermoflexibacter ruber]SFF13226.1 Endonuclease, Uma2 family (restriction endonuclease fold) [Thermoflexibacter ruber]